MKKVVFYLFIIVAVLCGFADVTALQLLPFAGAIVMMGLNIFGKRKLEIAISVLSVLMILINGVMLSVVDVTIWLLAAIVFFPRK